MKNLIFLNLIFGSFLSLSALADSEIPLGQRAYIISGELYEPSKIYPSNDLELKKNSVLKDPKVGINLKLPVKKEKVKLNALAATKKAPLVPVSAGKSRVVERALEPQIAFDRQIPSPGRGFRPLDIDMQERSKNTISEFRPSAQ